MTTAWGGGHRTHGSDSESARGPLKKSNSSKIFLQRILREDPLGRAVEASGQKELSNYTRKIFDNILSYHMILIESLMNFDIRPNLPILSYKHKYTYIYPCSASTAWSSERPLFLPK